MIGQDTSCFLSPSWKKDEGSFGWKTFQLRSVKADSALYRSMEIFFFACVCVSSAFFFFFN